ncbi:hypothetical protein K1T71_000787 [Dendrolimus kikuchii]|uniref:Uncharacterized protein n=2 Tax=Dendrolimus kikuchii TaxID=765133 RepID=A0ACC1DK85_9NEOP|nr:hypothetical protein K1T71_005781 [Dendrolimus kikuchii]KAJ0184364.1 hypothetical protein K1T71_000787 [Dendrolimus kikuchii]
MSWEQPPTTQVPATASTKQEIAEYSNLAQITVSSRIPDFWTDQPRLWFAQFDAIVANQKLSEGNKYNLVVTKLNKESIQQVTDLLLQPPQEKPYASLKERLLTVYEESEIRKVQKLLSEIDLGNQKPSQLLRKMKDLAQDKFPEQTLRIMWTGHLPPAVRAILTISEVAHLDKLAKLADSVMETSGSRDTIHQVTETAGTTSSSDRVIAEIAKLNQRVDELSRRRTPNRYSRYQRERTNSRNRQRETSAQRRNSSSADWLCFYHFRFRNRAKKCIKPCNWNNGSANMEPRGPESRNAEN